MPRWPGSPPGGSHAIGDFLKSFAFRVTIQTAFTFTAHAV